ncbi:alpha/beta-hydrolase [Pluteus cervinus]|uniref:Alpha/beta-hydrolase n=1 Tax=Pluteus cervinus TaxID=181527 RepID=A0ACD3BGE9_9AGAR|nr:alpha/beta-hydrolase [Pluteus cervinus]
MNDESGQTRQSHAFQSQTADDDLDSPTKRLSFATSMSRSNPAANPVSRPVVRWLKDLSWTPSPSPSPTSLAALNEALHDPLPRPPPPARLPPSFAPSKVLTRPPPFFDNLTRSTLPTASLCSPTPPSLPRLGSTPTRSSIDSLRSVARPIHTTARVDHPATPPTNWLWFLSEDSERSESPTEDDGIIPQSPIQKQCAHIVYLSPNNPIVFCHGLLGFDSVTIGLAIAPLQVTHWRGIKEALEENGAQVLITRVPATSSPVDRAKVLEQKISEVYPGRSVHLIGHSMGGLDCRYLTTHLTNRKFRVLSITTIATPHRGSSFADHFLSTVGADRMSSVLSILDMLPNGGGDGKAFESLTIENMKKFNEETPNVKGVRYFSWGAVYDPGFIDTWKWPHSVVQEKEGPNDGLVSVESAKWGTYLGTLTDVNHLDLVGWINTARYKWAEMRGKEIKFRPAAFYLGIADMLAREVEGQREDGRPSTPDTQTPPPEHEREVQEQMVQSLKTSDSTVRPKDGHPSHANRSRT